MTRTTHTDWRVLVLLAAACLLTGCPNARECPEGQVPTGNIGCVGRLGDDDDDAGDDTDDDDSSDDDDSAGDDDDTGDDDTGDDDTGDDDTGDDDDDTTPTPPLLAVDGQHFVDADGGIMILRGVNVAGNSKVPPFVPFTDMSLMNPLPGWGINVIRLLFNWEAFEGTEGVYDESYLDAITAIADAAWQLGMYVIVDFHQDGFSRYHGGGCGDGFPQWAVHDGASLDTPDNGPDCENWATQITLDTDMHDSWSAFYAGEGGVRTRYLLLWQHLATHFAQHEGVIGYDLINEPWGWEDSELSPLYEDAASNIRGLHEDAILFIEGTGSTNNGVIQTGLTQPSFDNYAYAPHFYETSVITTHFFTGLSFATDLAFSTMTSKANEWNVPLFLGEFGAFEDTTQVEAYMDLQYEKLDEFFASGTQWNWTPSWTPTAFDGWNGEDLSIVDNTGALRDNFKVRAAPRRIAGTPLEFTADESSVVLRWTHDPTRGATQVFLPANELWGTNSVQLNATGPVSCSYDVASLLVSCTGNSGSTSDATVTITAG